MKLFKIIFICICLLSLSNSAFAISLDEAKSKGFVGEQQNGYLGIVSNPSAEVQSLVAEVNAQRKVKYFEIANKNGTTLAAVEALAGKRAVAETAAGRYVQNASAQWEKR